MQACGIVVIPRPLPRPLAARSSQSTLFRAKLRNSLPRASVAVVEARGLPRRAPVIARARWARHRRIARAEARGAAVGLHHP
jgi:hypothetical protein